MLMGMTFDCVSESWYDFSTQILSTANKGKNIMRRFPLTVQSGPDTCLPSGDSRGLPSLFSYQRPLESTRPAVGRRIGGRIPIG
jgi:hypothetical protein